MGFFLLNDISIVSLIFTVIYIWLSKLSPHCFRFWERVFFLGPLFGSVILSSRSLDMIFLDEFRQF